MRGTYDTPKRSHVIKTRLDDDEYEFFLRKCKVYGMNQSEIEDLTSSKNAGYTEYRESQKREKELQTVKANIEKMLRLQEPEHEEVHMNNEQEL